MFSVSNKVKENVSKNRSSNSGENKPGKKYDTKKTKVELFISDEQNSWQKTKGIQKTTPFKRGRKI